MCHLLRAGYAVGAQWGKVHCNIKMQLLKMKVEISLSSRALYSLYSLPSNPEPARCMYLVPLAYGVTISSPLFAMEGAAMGVGAARTPEACITLGATIETRCFQPSHMQRSVDL